MDTVTLLHGILSEGCPFLGFTNHRMVSSSLVYLSSLHAYVYNIYITYIYIHM
jgi:hypothetical protein